MPDTRPPSPPPASPPAPPPTPYEMAGERLKLKYRMRKPVSQHGSSASNTGKPIRGTRPLGMPRHYRGKTRYP